MKRLIFLMTIAVSGIALAEDAATIIPILNSRFDVDTLACGAPCSYTNVIGWIAGPQTGVFKASATQYPGTPSSGIYVGYIGGGCSTCSTGSIMQTLAATVQANTTYTLTVVVGARADIPFTGYIAALGAGNVTLASGNRPVPVGGTFAEAVITYNSDPTPTQLGLPLQIFIRSFGTGQVNIAGVSLTAR